jgi:hypothetical protein
MANQQRNNEGKPQLSYVFSNFRAIRKVFCVDAMSFEDIFLFPVEPFDILYNISSFLSRNANEDLFRALTANVQYLHVALGGDLVPQPDQDTSLATYLFTHDKAWAEYARVCEIGAKKYARGNYRLGETYNHYLDSGCRHVVKLLKGIEIDEESGCHHAAHSLWNIWQVLDQPNWRDDRLPAVNKDDI